MTKWHALIDRTSPSAESYSGLQSGSLGRSEVELMVVAIKHVIQAGCMDEQIEDSLRAKAFLGLGFSTGDRKKGKKRHHEH
jgi:hypothetical protein